MPFLDKVRISAMSRGVLVVDENLLFLKGSLEDRNIRVLVPEQGWDDSFIKRVLLPHRIFVTNNAKDFERDISSFEYGLIDIPQSLLVDPAHAAKLISDAIIEHGLWSLPRGFLLRFQADGSTELQQKTD